MSYCLKDTIESIFRNIWKTLGHGHTETIYGNAFAVSLREQDIKYEPKRIISIMYENKMIGTHTIDMIIENKYIVKIVSFMSDSYEKNLKFDLKMAECSEGLIVCIDKDEAKLKWINQ